MKKQLGELTAIDVRSVWNDEARDFTPWLAQEDNLALLSDTVDMELELQGIEVPVGPYAADIVARDANSDQTVVVENQLEKTNHDHLGKVLTYASGLNAGAVIWIAQEFTEEHRRVLDFLNEAASPALRLYGLEIQLWSIGGSPPAPKFNVVARPNEFVRPAVGEDLTEAQRTYLAFWQAFREYMTTQGSTLKLRAPGAHRWFEIAVGRTGFFIQLTASTTKKRTGCALEIVRNASQAFALLSKQRARIEDDLGEMQWQELSDRKRSRIVQYRSEADITDTGKREECFAWLKDRAESFHRVFSPIVKELDLSEDSVEDEFEETDADE